MFRRWVVSKCTIISLAMSAVCVANDEEVADEIRHQMQLKLSKAYSECVAYYEVAASDIDHANGIDSAVADEMKSEAQYRAAAHVADVEGAVAALKILNADLAQARTHLSELKEGDTDALADEMNRFRSSCRLAVNDPSVFVERTLRGDSRRKRYIQLDPDLTLDMILKQAKPVTKPMDISKCKKPAVAHRLALDDLLVDGAMICAQITDGACDSERSWMSYPQYIETQYPDSEIAGYSMNLRVTFKGGKTQQVRTLTACVIAPQMST